MKKIILKAAKVITSVNTAVFFVCTSMVFLIVVLIAIDVVFRYFLTSPTAWGMELAKMLFGPYFMLAGAYLLHVKGHVNVDIVYGHLHHQTRLWLDIAIFCIVALLSLIFFLQSYPLAVESYLNQETSFTTWNPVVWPVKVVVPVSLMMLALQALSEIVFLLSPVENVAHSVTREV